MLKSYKQHNLYPQPPLETGRAAGTMEPAFFYHLLALKPLPDVLQAFIFEGTSGHDGRRFEKQPAKVIISIAKKSTILPGG